MTSTPVDARLKNRFACVDESCSRCAMCRSSGIIDERRADECAGENGVLFGEERRLTLRVRRVARVRDRRLGR